MQIYVFDNFHEVSTRVADIYPWLSSSPVMQKLSDEASPCRSFTAGRAPGCCCVRLRITGAAGSCTLIQRYASVCVKSATDAYSDLLACSADLIVSALAAAGISRGHMLRLNDPRRPPQQAGDSACYLQSPRKRPAAVDLTAFSATWPECCTVARHGTVPEASLLRAGQA